MKFIGQNAQEAREVKATLHILGYEASSYSGRAMYGKECLAVVMTSGLLPDLFFALGEYCGRVGAEFPHITHVNTDSMGYDTVVYWKAYEVASEEETV